jgi:hypothetical protein
MGNRNIRNCFDKDFALYKAFPSVCSSSNILPLDFAKPKEGVASMADTLAHTNLALITLNLPLTQMILKITAW